MLESTFFSKKFFEIYPGLSGKIRDTGASRGLKNGQYTYDIMSPFLLARVLLCHSTKALNGHVNALERAVKNLV